MNGRAANVDAASPLARETFVVIADVSGAAGVVELRATGRFGLTAFAGESAEISRDAAVAIEAHRVRRVVVARDQFASAAAVEGDRLQPGVDRDPGVVLRDVKTPLYTARYHDLVGQ